MIGTQAKENRGRSAVRLFAAKHKVAVCSFVFVVLYNYVIVGRFIPWQVNEISYTYHLVDFSLGFCSKFLPGAIYRFFFGERSTLLTATIYETVLLLVFFAVLSVFLERFINELPEDKRSYGYLILLFYLSGPFTFSIFTGELGMLDVYWLFFSTLFFIVLNSKAAYVCIPVLYVLCVMVHFSSVVCYLILMSIILLYRFSEEPGKNKKFLIILVISVLLALGTVLYFVAFEQKNLVYDYDTFNQILKQRGSQNSTYYDTVLYGRGTIDAPYFPEDAQAIESSLIRSLYRVFYVVWWHLQIRLEYAEYWWYLPVDLMFIFPLLAGIYKCFMGAFRASEKKLIKLCYFLCMVQFPFTLAVGILSSIDDVRWMTHAFLIMLTDLIYLMLRDDRLRSQVFALISKYRHTLGLDVYFAGYFLTFFWAYH